MKRAGRRWGWGEESGKELLRGKVKSGEEVGGGGGKRAGRRLGGEESGEEVGGG